MSKILLVQVGPEQAGVGVGGLLYGRTLGDGGTRVVVGRGGWRHLLLHRGLVVLPDEGGDVEAPEWFLVWQFGWRGQFALLVLLLVLAVARTLVRAAWRTDGAAPADDVI